jgi:D-alanyl-D-alanine carboxypeptidase
MPFKDKLLMKLLTFILMVLLVCSCKKPFIEPTTAKSISASWTDSSASHPDNSVFRSLIEKYHKLGLPGISLLVRNSHGTWFGAIGKADIERNIAFEPGQVASVASVTKFIIGALVFKLIEDSVHSGLGYNSLYQPITTWLPSRITDRIANGSVITLGDCMKHETGVPDITDQSAFQISVLNQPNKNWQPEEILDFIYNMPALFNPRDTAVYSNTNTVLVSMIIDAATGKRHGDLLHQYVFTPLQMNNTYYQSYEALPNTVAQGYFDLYNNGKILNVSNLVAGSGNGYYGIYSNLFDLYSFIDAVLLKKTFLSAKSLNIMQTWGKTDYISRYGYGIMQRFTNRGINAGIGHSGRGLGSTANLFYFPNKGVTHIFIINYGTASESRLRNVFYDFQNELLDLMLK